MKAFLMAHLHAMILGLSPTAVYRLFSCSSACPISKHPLTMMHCCCLGLAVASTSPVHPRALCPPLLYRSPSLSSTFYSLYLFLPCKTKLLCHWLLKQEISGGFGAKAMSEKWCRKTKFSIKSRV